MTKIHKILLAILAILILFGGYVYWHKKSNVTPDNSNPVTVVATSTSGAVVTQGTGGYTIEQVPITADQLPQPIPDLNRPVRPAGSVAVSPEAVTYATAKIPTLQASLKATPSNLGMWLQLGIYQKMAGDYAGAAISFEYASKLNTKDFVALGDLGLLDGNA